LHKSPHIREFSKNSKYYEKYSFLQKNIAKELLKEIDNKPKKILDLGCGNGIIFSLIDWKVEKFVGIDFSKEMLSLHPKNKNITLLEKDFDLIEGDYYQDFDLVVSSSSLQWSKNIFKMINNIQKNSKNFLLAFYCDKTFVSLRKWLGIDTFLPNVKDIIKSLDEDVSYETKMIYLEFEDALSQLRYIKKSGVSGGVKRVSTQNLRQFIKQYKNNKLEFEVIFISRIL